MKIALVINAVLPIRLYGGTERVIYSLGRELFRAGHQVTFIAAKGTVCDFARVVEIAPDRSIASQIPSDIDIVHFQDGVPLRYETECGKPHIVTYHGNSVTNTGMSPNSVFVSLDHARRHGCDSFVYNGLDWDEYGPVDLNRHRHGFHFLGKAAWRVKNVAGAIDVTKSVPAASLEVLGGHRFNIKMGWRFTFSPRIHFHGMVNDAVKADIITRSQGLLFPVKWNEPFGLAVTESLYLGSPVFATPYGSLPELVTSEVGYLTDSSADMVEHIKAHIGGYAPRTCHEYAAELFSAKVMARNYVSKYETVLSGQTLVPEFAPMPQSGLQSMPWRR